MNLEIPELYEITTKLDQLLAAKAATKPIPEWSSTRMAWSLKGGCAWETMRTQRRLQPKGGHYDAYVGGVGVFSRETIQEWLSITDDQLEAYHLRHQTGCVIIRKPPRARRSPRSALEKRAAT